MSSLIGFIFSGFAQTGGTTSGGQPINGRDLIALLATLGVDLGLFALTALNPPGAAPVRRWGAATQAEMVIPTREVIRQLTDAINTATRRAPGTDIEWVRRHFIHHKRASYFVIPNLYSCDENKPGEAAKCLAMNQLAGVLDDLDLVRWPNHARWWSRRKDELAVLRAEERHQSGTDLTDIRKERLKQMEAQGIPINATEAERIRNAEPIRNHGLFSKAERVLAIAGWSEKARRDIEIFRLVDQQGLTPLLMVLNEVTAPGMPPVGASTPLNTEREALEYEARRRLEQQSEPRKSLPTPTST